ncbi:sensor histidine kinase [Micromonospora sagamiensis]|uniref:histidine kinase n=1 Tax=Micromonospora sagamiensis TaxID=47875 RepID=A0A562WAG4_9ACTN|nr:sensor histidine kinase [Micromonospora sagamiensis]TWJ26981.1 multi-sensor signal transduction histidine kinase [Micromonospora sagamiensis]BCL14129.1 histidine kinase [Micromonospora sagamiensis]
MTAVGRGWTLRQRVVGLLAVVGVLLIGLAAAEATVAARNRSHTDALLTRTGPLRVQAQELLNALLDQETSVRGYAVSGDRQDLVPYDDGVRQEQKLIESIGRLVDDYPGIRRDLDVVRAQAEQWRRTVAVPVITTVQQDGTTAAQGLIDDRTRQQFDQVRASVARLDAGIIAEREANARSIRQTGNLLVVLLVIAALVVVVAGVLLLVSLERMVVRPLTGLADQVREVAEGDYQHHISGSGPPEFQQLADDVEAMRRKIAKDLTEVREARERIEWVNTQLQKQAEELVRSNRDLEQFAYVASHDLQEPLRKVASFCQLLQRRYAGQLDDRADQYIAFAVDGAQRMQRLINDLLAFSRIGRLTTGFTEVDMNKVMADVAGQTEVARQQAEAELTWSELPTIRGEEPLLTNLLTNLVSNSVKFRRPDVPPRVHVSARLCDDEWEITCQDNGIGIEPEFADKIFVIFQRLHSKDAYPGTGIGLAIVKKIVEYHGGRVWVDTDTEEGTAIRFTLPALPGDVEAARAAAEEPDGDTGATEGDESLGSTDAGEGVPARPTDMDDTATTGPTADTARDADDQRPDQATSGRTDGTKETVG